MIKRLKCWLGIHDWQTIRRAKCKIKAHSIFTGVVEGIEARASIQYCTRCPAKRGYMETALGNQKYPAWEIEDGMDRADIPKGLVV